MSPVSSPGSSAVSSSRDTRGSAVARLVQPAEEALLGIPGEPLDAEGQREHTPPALRHRVTGYQRADPASVGHAGLDDEPGGRERPAADAGARPSPARLRQLLRPAGDARQLGQPARDRQAELGARASPMCGRDRLVHVHLDAPAEPEPRRTPGGRTRSARSACDPDTRTASSDRDLTLTTTRGDSTPTPKPPKRRAPTPAGSSMPKCSRAGAVTTIAVTFARRRSGARSPSPRARGVRRSCPPVPEGERAQPRRARRRATSAARRRSTLRRRRAGPGTVPAAARPSGRHHPGTHP